MFRGAHATPRAVFGDSSKTVPFQTKRCATRATRHASRVRSPENRMTNEPQFEKRLEELREQAWKDGVVPGKGVDVAGGPIPRKPATGRVRPTGGPGYYGQP